MDLKLYIKQTPQFNIQQQQIYYAGSNPQSLKVVVGSLPQLRQWPGFGSYIDVTGDVSDLYKLKLTWTNDRDSDGASTPGAFQPKKSVSGTLSFEGDTYRLIKKWLIDDVSAPLNSVSVKILHTGCGSYEEYVIKAADLRWCENAVCVFEVTLKQKDEALSCIQRTMIADNHQGWFHTQPLNGKKHPRFSYCNEHRPNGLLVISWWMMSVLGIIFYTIILFIIVVIINPILVLLGLIVKGLQKLGIGKSWKIPKPINPGDVLDSLGQFFVEAGGCGREHPAPLVRDYIYNVCKKCGLDTDALPVTAPIFFAESMYVETSARGIVWTKNYHFNACYLNAPVQRGIRRFMSANIISSSPNTSDYYIPDNTPLHTLDTFLDELKGLYNAEWRVVNNKLYFQRKDFYVNNGGYVLDLTDGSTDRLKLLEGICYEWNEVKYPAYTEGLYADDATDSCGNEAQKHMNSLLSFGNTDDNPNFEGKLEKIVQVGATKFRLDGASEDYIYDAMQVVVNGSLLAPFAAGLFFGVVAPQFEKYADYGLLLKDETCALPKILIWDGVSFDNAKAVRPYSAYPIDPQNGPPMPTPNSDPRYGTSVTKIFPVWGNWINPQMVTSNTWYVKHPPETFVRGESVTLAPFYEGYYTVTDFFAIFEVKKPVLLVNYYMYFEPGFEDTMWDWFHWIDDPQRNNVMNITYTAKLELCCDMLQKLQVFGDASGIVLGHKMKLPGAYFTDGKIKEIEVSYDTKNELGQYIQLKGTM